MNPNWNHIVREHLAVLRLPPEREIEIVEELALHLEAAYEDALADGLSEAEAEERAVRGYDWPLLECELSRAEQPLAAQALRPSLELIERKGGIRMESFIQDLRFGARMLMKQHGFTLIAVLTLSLGIGANTAIFSVVNAVLLRPLPYSEPERLVFFYDSAPGFGIQKLGLFEAEFLRLREQARALERVSLYTSTTLTLTGVGEPERLSAGTASGDLFAALGVPLALGRSFKLEEEPRGQGNVVILSHGFWQRKFAG